MTPRAPANDTPVLCIGAALWDVIGRAPVPMERGADVPGRIARIAGGVAMNIAMTLTRFGLRPVMLGAVGRDPQGDALAAEITRLGIVADHLYRSPDLPTDIYMAIEGSNGLIAAIADAHSLEAAGERILTPLEDGTLGSEAAPFEGLAALDGNLTDALLTRIADAPIFARTDLRVAPASPGKALRLLPFLRRPGATLYVNLEEAGLLCQTRFDSARTAAEAMVARGATRVLVTDGASPAAEAGPNGAFSIAPPRVMAARVTGAGDTFMAAHIAAEVAGQSAEPALDAALSAAARYVSGEHAV